MRIKCFCGVERDSSHVDVDAVERLHWQQCRIPDSFTDYPEVVGRLELADSVNVMKSDSANVIRPANDGLNSVLERLHAVRCFCLVAWLLAKIGFNNQNTHILA